MGKEVTCPIFNTHFKHAYPTPEKFETIPTPKHGYPLNPYSEQGCDCNTYVYCVDIFESMNCVFEPIALSVQAVH